MSHSQREPLLRHEAADGLELLEPGGVGRQMEAAAGGKLVVDARLVAEFLGPLRCSRSL